MKIITTWDDVAEFAGKIVAISGGSRDLLEYAEPLVGSDHYYAMISPKAIKPYVNIEPSYYMYLFVNDPQGKSTPLTTTLLSNMSPKLRLREASCDEMKQLLETMNKNQGMFDRITPNVQRTILEVDIRKKELEEIDVYHTARL